jgi:ATP-dependent Clp protease ATP-binding subunit ClpA
MWSESNESKLEDKYQDLKKYCKYVNDLSKRWKLIGNEDRPKIFKYIQILSRRTKNNSLIINEFKSIKNYPN